VIKRGGIYQKWRGNTASAKQCCMARKTDGGRLDKAQGLRLLEAGNLRSKHVVADLSLDKGG
jgi:hypothetical protein